MRNKKLSIVVIVRQNITQKPLRSMGFIVLIGLTSFFIFFCSLLGTGLMNGLKSTEERLGADILIVPEGSESDLEGFLLKGTPSTYYMDEATLEKIRSTQGVSQVTTQVDVGSLNAACCASAIQLIGIDTASDFVIGPWISSMYDVSQLKDDEIIIGNSINGDPGSTLLFFDTPFKVVAVLDRTGMGYDEAAFMNVHTARKMAELRAQTTGEQVTENYSKVVSSVLVNVAGDTTPFLVSKSLESNLESEPVSISKSENIIENVSKNVQGMLLVMKVFLLVLWGISLAIVVMMYIISLNERRKEFAVYTSLGAPKKSVVQMILGEITVLNGLAVLSGIGIGGSLFYLFNGYIREKMSFPFLEPTLEQQIGMAGATILATMIISGIVAVYSVYQVSRKEVYRVIQED